MSVERTDVAIIGGGYYGAFVANVIKETDPNLDVVVLEKEAQPFSRASSTNQGQFHMGYMYSGDKALASECADNISRFSAAFPSAIDGEVTSYYGIHQESEISPEAYKAFCDEVDLPLEEVSRPTDIFGEGITAAFKSAEKTFNSAEIQRTLLERMAVNGIRLVTNFEAYAVQSTASGIEVINGNGSIEADQVFNATFADINALHDSSRLPKVPLQYDTFLHFVLGLPDPYKSVAATVIRGPYASLLPSTYRNGHVLASGRHRRVSSSKMDKPSEAITDEDVHTIYRRALSEARDYLPMLADARYTGHTIGTRAAHFDPATNAYTSKAIVFKDFGGANNYHTVLGGKVSCLFDIEEDIKHLVS